MTEPPTPPAPAEKKYDDTEVNTFVARARREAEASAKTARDNELAQQYGVPVDQIPGMLEAAKKAADKDKSEAVLAREAADSEKAAAAKDRTEAAELRHATRVERALLRAGLPVDGDGAEQLLEDAMALVRVDAAADDTALKAAVEAVKTRHPTMFAAKGTPPAPYGQPPDVRPPSGRQSPPTTGRDPQVERQLARRREWADSQKAS